MKKLPILEKLREFKCSLTRPKPPVRRPVTRLNATARRIAPSAMDDYDDQPQTKLSSAFIVVLILHIVAVGGIFAFKGIKAHRLSREIPVATASDRAATASRIAAADRAAALAATSAALPEATPAPLAQRVYKAHGGETLSKVAAQQGVGAGELAQYNGLNPATILKPNQSIVIPPSKMAKATSAPAVVAKATTAPAASKTASAATPASTSPNSRAAFLATKKEQSEDAAFLKTTPKPGSGSSSNPAIKPFVGKTYTVAKSDTVTSIARKYNVSTDALMKLNKIEDPKKLQPNTTLQIPAKKTE